MVKGKRLGLVGKVILGAGAVGGLVGGCGIVVDEVIRSEVRKEIDPRSTVVNAGDDAPHKYWSALKIYKNVDLGDNKKVRLGEIDSSINPKRTGITVSYISSNVRGSVSYIVIDSDDRVIGRTTLNYANRLSTTNNYSSDNCLDQMIRNGNGEYTIIASRGAETISKKVVINSQD